MRALSSYQRSCNQLVNVHLSFCSGHLLCVAQSSAKLQPVFEGCIIRCIYWMHFYIAFIYNDLCDDMNPPLAYFLVVRSAKDPVIRAFS